MTIRKVTAEDTERFFRMLCRLDEETAFMLYEPGEREQRTKDLSRLSAKIDVSDSDGDLLLAAVDDQKEIQGFIWAERGKLNRILHTAYIVVGIRRAYRRQGIGTEFFRRLDEWAKANGLTRLELTVECANTAAIRLYEKHGFRVEGLRSGSVKVDGAPVDEYYVAKILNGTE